MNRARFNALPNGDQVAAVVTHGRFVATRWQEVDEAVHMHQMPGDVSTELTG